MLKPSKVNQNKPPMNMSTDQTYMHAALALARRGLGRTAPNPAVGCIIVKDGIVVGRGWTGDGGRPHAETQALKQAGAQARGACAYVTLEPCHHHGETSPCSEALVSAGVKRCVVACTDPDPRTAGQGSEHLRAAGVEVVTSVLEQEALALNKGFILRVTESRPFVTLKTAISADGKIAVEPGKQHWMTGARARAYAHLLRSQHDAILVGIGTVLADDPALTTRLPGYRYDGLRVILDSGLRISLDSQLFKDMASHFILILHNSKEGGGSLSNIDGAVLIKVDPRDLKAVLECLAQRGITRLLVEGGAQIHTSFLESGLYDQLCLFKGPDMIGPGGVDALVGHDIARVAQDFDLMLERSISLCRDDGEDLLEIYGRRA